MSKIEARLAELGYTLPPPPPIVHPLVNEHFEDVLTYLYAPRHSGESRNPRTPIPGFRPAPERRNTFLSARPSLAANLRMKCEGEMLDKVSRILKVVGMVNSSPQFYEQAQVVDGASDLFVALFGDRGRHSRSAPGMATLPGNSAVIV